ncbi:MAG: glycosyltransferase family 4 protein, partial [Pseudomonadota bacterium]
EAIARLKNQADLVIIGDGEERSSLEALSQKLDAPVQFRGFQSHQTIKSALRDADALVLPSLTEAGGAVILEAFASSTPAIATAWGGPTDYIDETTGMLIAPTNRSTLVSGFEEAMLKFIDDPDLTVRLGTKARDRVESDFSWREKVDTIVEYYRNVSQSSV